MQHEGVTRCPFQSGRSEGQEFISNKLNIGEPRFPLEGQLGCGRCITINRKEIQQSFLSISRSPWPTQISLPSSSKVNAPIESYMEGTKFEGSSSRTIMGMEDSDLGRSSATVVTQHIVVFHKAVYRWATGPESACM